MKLSRLLATVALIAGGLALPAPAAADTVPTRPPSADALRDICTIFAGTYVRDRLTYGCEISDGTITCTQRCELRLAERLSTEPLQEPCELGRGTFIRNWPGQFACQLAEGDFWADCPTVLGWMSVCDLIIIVPSEQPMTD